MEPKVIKTLLILHDISQKEIAKALNITTVTVYQAITGQSRCYQVEEYIAKRVGVSQESLFGKLVRRHKYAAGIGKNKNSNSKRKAKEL